MRINIVIAQLLCGGAELLIYRLYQQLISENNTVQLIVLGDIDKQYFPNISQNDLCCYTKNTNHNKVISNYTKISFIRQSIKTFKPDVVVSFIDSTNILSLIATRMLNIPVVVSERNNPHKSTMSKIWFYLRRLTYPMADSLVVANMGLKEICQKIRFNKHIKIIPNLLQTSDLEKDSKVYKRLIAVGSLTQQKRFDLLIDAINILHHENTLNGYTLDIYGEGPLKIALQNRIKQYSLANIVNLKGKSSQIFEEYVTADIFILSSDYEGQPNVLLEAMSCGLACIATDCKFGPGEIIDHQRNGLLTSVNSANELAKAIDQLISDPELRDRLGKKAQQTLHDNFSRQIIFQKWMDLFKEVQLNYES
jgi:GalNAc-alpha-(1->4)-GalNAc-alpha-(1->3)-diNAcBac-PP-undecaprenol alpha-1,4-N-acetyl-D-galactosaminyltransferase